MADLNGTGGVSNTRPERTRQNSLRVLVDWVSCTFYLESDFDGAKVALGLEKLEMEHHDWGMNTFHEHVRFGSIVIQRKNEYEYQLSLSGQGCREYEALGKYDWVELFGILKNFLGGRFTRLDLAIDDFGDHYDVGKIREYLDKGLFVSRITEWEDRRRKRRTIKEDKDEIALTMDSLYMGSLKSRLSINFYDKRLEREAKEQVTDGSWDTWTRTELRLKREYADQAADMVLIYGDALGEVAMGILNKNIRFVRKRSKDSNIRRRDDAIWWANFVGKAQKLKFSLQAPDRTIEKVKEWVNHSVAPSLAAIRETDPDQFDDWMQDLIKDGTERLNEKHGLMINQARELNLKKAAQKIRDIQQYQRPAGYETQWENKKAQAERPNF